MCVCVYSARLRCACVCACVRVYVCEFTYVLYRRAIVRGVL